MVVVYHLAFWWWQPGQGANDFYEPLQPLGPFVSYGWVGVPIFFVISGFVIAFSASHKDARGFVIGRALRLYPAAWICASITFLVAGSWSDYLRSVLLSPIGPWVSGVYWTLGIEIVFYALVSLALWRGWNLTRLALGLGAWSTAFWALNVPFDFSAIEGYRGYLLLAHDGIFFAVGMLLFQKRHLLVAAGLAGVGFIAVAWRSHAMDIAGAPFFVAPLVWAAATAVVAWCAFRNPPFRWLPTRTLGLMTYPLYLIHAEVGRAVMVQFDNAWVALTAGLTTVLLTAYAVLWPERRLRRLLKPSQRFDRAGAALAP